MTKFFDYRSHYRTGIFYDLNIYERIIPLIIIGIIIYALYKYRGYFQENPKREVQIRYGLGIALLIFYSSHYILRIQLYGFTDTINLPFHLCSIAMFLCIIMMFTLNKALHSFVLIGGTLGVIISLVYPVIGYDSSYYRYYQFMFAHGILLISPLYVSFVQRMIPSKKDVIVAYVILQSLAFIMAIVNYYYNTDFFFMFIDPSKIDKFPILKLVGGIPFYIVWVEVFAFVYFYSSYRLFKHIKNRT